MPAWSIALFAASAAAEIAGAYFLWSALRGDGGLLLGAAGVLALGLYGILAALQPSHEFGRVLGAYGGLFIAGSIGWAMAFDGFRPDRFDLAGAAICLAGAALLAYAPR